LRSFSVGILDYGLGNHASVVHSLKDAGFRVVITDEKTHLDAVDVLILPGVGAFSPAMTSMQNKGLIDYLFKQAKLKRPIIGICLGMQLLTESSFEHKHTSGLGLIPGSIHPFPNRASHIGWNTLEFLEMKSKYSNKNNENFYFNHSFFYQGPSEYKIAMTQHSILFPSIIRKENIVGLQFHPEKSQLAGKTFLKNLINELMNECLKNV